jgi:hypothetical protein
MRFAVHKPFYAFHAARSIVQQGEGELHKDCDLFDIYWEMLVGRETSEFGHRPKNGFRMARTVESGRGPHCKLALEQ